MYDFARARGLAAGGKKAPDQCENVLVHGSVVSMLASAHAAAPIHPRRRMQRDDVHARVPVRTRDLSSYTHLHRDCNRQ